MSTILITGASHGVGKAFAIACAQSGRFSKIILNGGTDTAALEDTARRVSAAGDLVCLADVGDVSDLAYVQGLRERFGPVDTLVNNAGISRIGLLTDMSPDVWDRVLRVNVTSLYNTCHTYVPDMVLHQSPGKRTGALPYPGERHCPGHYRHAHERAPDRNRNRGDLRPDPRGLYCFS